MAVLFRRFRSAEVLRSRSKSIILTAFFLFGEVRFMALLRSLFGIVLDGNEVMNEQRLVGATRKASARRREEANFFFC